MADNDIEVRSSRQGNAALVLSDYSSGAISAGTNKREWIVPFFGSIVDVLADSETANGDTDGGDILDINLNGTTIYTNQDNRPTLAQGDTGAFASGNPDVTSLVPGDIISYDVDSVDGGGGSSRFKLAIIIQGR